MVEREDPSFSERFDILEAARADLERHGYFLNHIPKEHTEGLITQPLLQRLRTTIKKRGFAKVAGHVAITFSGYATDPREIYDIPEIRAYWKEVDRSLPELPALLTVLPITGYNGSGQHVMPLGTVDAVIDRPEAGRYDVHVVDGPQLIADAVSRIRQAGRKYHLSDLEVSKVVEQFRRNARGE